MPSLLEILLFLMFKCTQYYLDPISREITFAIDYSSVFGEQMIFSYAEIFDPETEERRNAKVEKSGMPIPRCYKHTEYSFFTLVNTYRNL